MNKISLIIRNITRYIKTRLFVHKLWGNEIENMQSTEKVAFLHEHLGKVDVGILLWEREQ